MSGTSAADTEMIFASILCGHAHKDMFRAGKVGAATWFGLLVATAVKLAIAFTMIGVFVAALLI
jgi:uncharacterized protein YqgC (DUF456 family)